MGILGGIDEVARELMLFAAVGLLIGGLDDLIVDLCFFWVRLSRPRQRLTVAALPVASPTRFAIFVPAWDEAAVIGAMLTTALARLGEATYRIYVGVYPNDPATATIVESIDDARVTVVVNPRPGPTTKADNLNALWRALQQDRDWPADAVILHDAEDVAHPDELRVFAALLAEHDVVQLPVLPIVTSGSRFVSGHYADEFAEAHTRSLIVRTALGAGLPLAGTGCAIAVARLEAVASERGGVPFTADSLTEDYELGLHLADGGVRGCFARVTERQGGPVVAVRAIFPGTMDAAVRQKARWMAGIALAGWDRTGWSRPLAVGDHWMRFRDRRAPLAIVVLATAYAASMMWGCGAGVHWLIGVDAAPYPGWMLTLLAINSGLLGWRLLMRMMFTGRSYGWREALLSAPRFGVGNVVALLAAPRALVLYVRLLGGSPPVWDKTTHEFPLLVDA